jgi:hypothetical protein
VPAREEAGEVEVGEHDVAVGAEEHVLGLEVAVHDAGGVDLGECGDDLGSVEARSGGAVGDGPRQELVRLGAPEEGGKVRVPLQT